MEFLVINKTLQPPKVSRIVTSSVCELQDSLNKAGVSDFSAYLNISDAALSEMFARIDSLENRISLLETEPEKPAAILPLVARVGQIESRSTNSDPPATDSGQKVTIASERNEGIIIFVAALLLLFFVTVFADWQYGFSSAKFGVEWFSYEEGPYGYDVYPLSFKYTTGLFVLAPLAVYGLLRALGILKRLFAFEAHLSKIVPSSDDS